MAESVEIVANGKWPLRVPTFRAEHWRKNPSWEPERLESMFANIRPGMVVYDIGAELGDISALLSGWVTSTRSRCRFCHEWVSDPERAACEVCLQRDGYETLDGTGGGVVLVEPAPWYWPTIRATFEANGLPDPIASFCGFIGDETRPYGRDENVWAASGWCRAARGKPTGREAFRHISDNGPALTLDDLADFADCPPDAITMDIEGAEILAIRGAQRVLQEHRPLVWVSVHAEAMFNDWGVYQAEFHSEFHRNGYEKAWLGFDHEQHWFYYPSERRDEVVLP